MKKALNKFYVDMDKYLYSLGLYRKMVARDACSLFRAVSERYYSQNYHRRVRQHCANFMRANRCKFELFVEGSFEKHLGRVENPNETVGQVEIKALSQLYRCCFLIYDYPGIPAKVISEDNFVVEVMLSHSINGHYDIIYPRTYHASAALRQSLLYELFYTRVFLSEETELCQAMEACRVGGQRYRHSTPEDQAHSREDVESGGAAVVTRGAVREGGKVGVGVGVGMVGGGMIHGVTCRFVLKLKTRQRNGAKLNVFIGQCPLEAPPRARLSLSYKVMRSLDAEYYRDVEFNIRLDTCEEMQKTDYKLFAGRQYLLGDNCQVHLEAIGKYSNAFNQEVETDSTAVTLIIEELRKKHPDLKPVNPVPAWNVAAPTRTGDLDLDSRGGRHHHHCNFRKIHGGNGGPGTELLMPPPSYYGGPAPSALPPRLQQVGHPHPHPPPFPGAMAHDPSAPPHHHPIARTPDYDASRWDLLSWMFNRLLFPPTDLNPVPAWNVAAPTRNGDLDLDSCGGRHHRHCNFRKIHGSSGGPGTELLMPPPSYYGGPAPSALPPRFQPAGHPHQQTPPFPGAMAYHPSAPPHHHPIARPPRYGASRWDLLSWMFNSRSCHQLAALNKECQFGFSEPMEDLSDMDPAIVCYQLEGGDTVFPLLPKKH
ncbi:putative bifunctional UDP-N-acetylglucosamine transferase and deubiquitinase ALG13 [Acanthopagrus latus]|uniref:putative bifunctional UDP-N-acetylglucosamine transferase and deubiquitinase ALG13 n=1 Tax=Acanthopagrus latus TaxID=8177 RepID=UPI00187CAE46|nr:putative bifunctional UDP-N-acetylglucosamine transferase and deubiquitinase ALG13 [Acanthopagrus latus]